MVNLPNDNIERNIKKASSADQADFIEMNTFLHATILKLSDSYEPGETIKIAEKIKNRRVYLIFYCFQQNSKHSHTVWKLREMIPKTVSEC